MSKSIHVIGSGFSGLTLAWELRRRGLEVCVYEKSERTGGLIHSVRTNSHLREFAANGILWNERLQRLSEELGVEFYHAKDEAKKRFIYRGGMRRWPLSLKESFLFLKNMARVLWLLKVKKDDTVKPQPQESVAEWTLRHFGEEVHQYLVRPALQGIYAGDTRKMSAQLIFKGFLGGGGTSKKWRGTFAPKDGMGSFLETLERKLLQKEVRFSMGAKIGDGETPPPDEPWVIATPAWEAAKIAGLKDPQLAEALSRIHSLSLCTVTLVWPYAREKLNGFGCLFPEKEGFSALGVLSNTDIFENRGPQDSETWILGGFSDPKAATESDEALLARVLRDREKLLGSAQKPDEVFVQKYEKAIPHYDLELEKALEDIKNQLSQNPSQLFLAGNYLGHLGLAKIYDDNILLAEKLAQIYGER
jgi:oxygen-dependent protoporphyrinogen oxidase